MLGAKAPAGAVVSCSRNLEVSGSTRATCQTSGFCVPEETASFRPVGSHAGEFVRPSLVILIGVPPSTGMVYRLASSPLYRTKTIRSPLGDQAGAPTAPIWFV